MPRLARLDIAGLLQHVIVRGIERRDIFIDDIDRQNFLDRITTLLPETGVRCYAWAILSNQSSVPPKQSSLIGQCPVAPDFFIPKIDS
jgi:hypothetical protein